MHMHTQKYKYTENIAIEYVHCSGLDQVQKSNTADYFSGGNKYLAVGVGDR